MTSQDEVAESMAPVAEEAAASGIALLFAEGERPEVQQIDRLLEGLPMDGALSFGHRGDVDSGCLELLYRGLSFDVAGLAPAKAAAMPVMMQTLGVDGAGLETVTLKAGQHLEGGAHLAPVLRAHLGVAAALMELPGVEGVMWAPSGVLMSPEGFRQSIGGWLAGGRFPVPGLVGLLRDDDGALLSHGLGFFARRQVRVEASGVSAETQAQIASALIVRLADGDGHVPAWITGSDGRLWHVSWDAGQGLATARLKG